jgi:polyisoprenoid-binding protein YceI
MRSASRPLRVTAPRGAAVTLALCALFAKPLLAEAELYTVPAGGSKVTFYAHATGHDFEGTTQDVRGYIRFDVADLSGTASGEVRVMASTLDTGIDRRNQNMWDLLEAVKHRDIVFTLEKVAVDAGTGAGSRGPAGQKPGLLPPKLTLIGTLEVRGVQKPLTTPVELEPAEGAVVVRGSFPVDMRDFGIEPPRVAFIMRTQPEVRVEFETRFKRAE